MATISHEPSRIAPERRRWSKRPGSRDVGVPRDLCHLAFGPVLRCLRPEHRDQGCRGRYRELAVRSGGGAVRVPRHLGRRKAWLPARPE